MTFLNLKSVTVATVFTVFFSVIAALVLPVGYFTLSYSYLHSALETEAEINSKLISRVISNNPELWRYETIRMEELLQRRPRSGTAETRRVYDNKNILVAESVNNLPFPQITVSHKVHDAGEVIGRIEISRSFRPILLKSGLMAIFGLFMGMISYRLLPFRSIAKAKEELLKANEFLRKIMEGSSNCLIVLDLSGKIQICNIRFETLCDSVRKELLGYRFYQLFAETHGRHVETELQKVITGALDSVIFETELSDKSGAVRNLVCRAEPLSNAGIINGLIVSLDDVTERIRQEEERLTLERHLLQAQKLESLGVLAGGIAHDFNNILSIILGYCETITEELNPSPANANYVRKIENAANRASNLCRQMLSYAGNYEPEQTYLDMKSLVTEIVKMLHSALPKNVQIELELGDLPAITADSSQIQQIVMNLIINAAEAIAERNGIISISLQQKEISDEQAELDYAGTKISAGIYVCLEVVDNGCGMDDVTKKRIFEPFYTTKFTGRGLGMSATLGIIKSHLGALQFYSTPGSGTTFRVYLPVHALPVAATDSRPALPPTCPANMKGTVLLVDDEEELRTLGTIRLSKIGFSVITASNGLEALDIYRKQQNSIDLILLDLLMPEMDGTETYSRLRDISLTIPIIFCSGCSINELSTKIFEDEYSGFLKKPYKPQQLHDVLFNCNYGLQNSKGA